jgi:hypothetical protein
MKNSSDIIGIEPATFRFVAQRLNHCATACSRHLQKKTIPGETLTPLDVKFQFVLRRGQRVLCLGRAVGEYCIQKYLLFSVTTTQNTLTHCAGKIQGYEW